jgi:hypothetical protein
VSDSCPYPDVTVTWDRIVKAKALCARSLCYNTLHFVAALVAVCRMLRRVRLRPLQLLFRGQTAPARALSVPPPVPPFLGSLTSFLDVLSSLAAHADRGQSRGGVPRGGDASPQRAAILDAALAHVSAQGWTADALAAGAESLGCVRLAQRAQRGADALHSRALLPPLLPKPPCGGVWALSRRPRRARLALDAARE